MTGTMMINAICEETGGSQGGSRNNGASGLHVSWNLRQKLGRLHFVQCTM
jgi:hypothetical protein